jgi:hypothetical protein
MDQNKTCIEMAFDLARSGKFTDLELLERRLHDEGYSTGQLTGPSLRRQVRALMVAATKVQVPVTPRTAALTANANGAADAETKT